jgi:hypothetical protein
VVLADGTLLTASATENPDLFWAIRGGGGNFGIVVEFEFQLVPVKHIVGGAIVLPATREVVRGYLDYSPTAPDGLTTMATITHAPPAPFIPEERVGEKVLLILPPGRATRRRASRRWPLRAGGRWRTRSGDPVPGDVQYMDSRRRRTASIRMMFTDELPDETIDDFLTRSTRARRSRACTCAASGRAGPHRRGVDGVRAPAAALLRAISGCGSTRRNAAVHQADGGDLGQDPHLREGCT